MAHSSPPALIIIDVQEGFEEEAYWGGNRNNRPVMEENITRILAHWREHSLPVFHVVHAAVEDDSPLRPECPGFAMKPYVTPKEGEPVIVKNVNSAFIGTDLEKRLREANINTLVLVGLTSDHCVSTSTRMGGNLGFKVFLACDAVATFDRVGHDGKKIPAEVIHEVSLASLHREFATVVDTATLLKKGAGVF